LPGYKFRFQYFSSSHDGSNGPKSQGNDGPGSHACYNCDACYHYSNKEKMFSQVHRNQVPQKNFDRFLIQEDDVEKQFGYSEKQPKWKVYNE